MTTRFTLNYDGTFDGFLTCVFEVYEKKIKIFNIQNIAVAQDSLFAQSYAVQTEEVKANRVWSSLKKRLTPQACHQLYCAFLSERTGIEDVMLRYIQKSLKSKRSIATDFSDDDVLKVAQLAKMVNREKHRMEAFIRFRLTKNGVYFANCDPDFNVLPLIRKHFLKRYADQQWIIYDLKRDYGLYYNLNKVDIVNFQFDKNFDPTKTSSDMFDEDELVFQTLWRDYFKSTNIKSRKNMRLHIQHVPKRYWKYLSEKLPE